VISLRLLSALNGGATTEEVERLCMWIENGIVEPAFHDRNGDTIASLRLTAAGHECLPIYLPTAVA
jgi:hypothetical protein